MYPIIDMRIRVKGIAHINKLKVIAEALNMTLTTLISSITLLQYKRKPFFDIIHLRIQSIKRNNVVLKHLKVSRLTGRVKNSARLLCF